MKKILILLMLFGCSAKAQFVYNGYYYLSMSEPDIFGKGFRTPNGRNDPPKMGNNFEVNNDYLEVHNSATESSFVSNRIKEQAFTSFFNKNSNVKVTVQVHGLKKVSLRPEYWSAMYTTSYYVIEALRADSVTIHGKIINSSLVGSKTMEQVIGIATGTSTIANKLIGIYSKDSTNKAGFVHFGKTQNDSISATIKDTTIYFAVRYAQPIQKIDKDMKRVPLCSNVTEDNVKTIVLSLSKDNSLNLLPYWKSGTCTVDKINNPISISETFSFDPTTNEATISLRKKDLKSNQPLYKTKPFYTETNLVVDGKAFFDNTVSFAGNNVQVNNNTNTNNIIFCDYKVEFDAVKRKVTIYNYQDGSYQTDIWMSPIKMRFFPSK